jgi:RimJ/RimL family protein N-acetyltransferase
MEKININDDFIINGINTYIVPFTIEHARSEQYLKWLRDYDVIKSLNLLPYIEKPVSKHELESYYNSIKKDDSILFFALHNNESDNFIGTVKISKIDLNLQMADIGIMIGEKKYWGHGFAQDILHPVCAFLFKQYNFRKLTCGMMAINPAMQAVFEKLGFKVEGLFRKTDYFESNYVDHVYMGCFKSEFIKEQRSNNS